VSLDDDDIATILYAEVGDEGMADMLAIVGIPATGNHVEDLKTMADGMGVDVEDLLYALFVEDEPLFTSDTWANLTEDG
jgi:hypothetical protein